jgi:fructose-1,6-bisphosphatase/inositol monophosphatase family enzyme
LDTLNRAADAVAQALSLAVDWGPSGQRDDQYASDITADEAAWQILDAAGLAVMSEETGARGDTSGVVVVIDPLDGSTNASRGVPWFATSLCAVDTDGPVASVVLDLVSGTRFEAQRGRGATRNGEAISSSGETLLRASVVGVSSLPPRNPGWAQFRALGASALDLCAVACGVLDGFIDYGVDAHGSWDYLGATLVCHEAGAVVADAHGRDLVTTDHAERRTPVAAASQELLDVLLQARSEVA